jgi:hypothetical protein
MIAAVILTDDELQSALRSLANTLLEEVLDKLGGFDLLTVFAFPPCDGAILNLDVALAEDLNDMNDFGHGLSNDHLNHIP